MEGSGKNNGGNAREIETAEQRNVRERNEERNMREKNEEIRKCEGNVRKLLENVRKA